MALGEEDAASRAAEARAWIDRWRMRQVPNGNGNGGSAMPEKPVERALSVSPATSSPEAPKPKLQSSMGPSPVKKRNALVQAATEYLHFWTSVGVLYAVDQVLKAAFAKANITLPSALGGMFGIVIFLLGVGEKNAATISSFFNPALNWIARWLPLFYIASLVTLPAAIKGIPGSDVLKILGILCVGTVGTLLFTAQTAVYIRELVKTENKEVVKAKPSPPFQLSHWLSWGAIAAVSLLVAVLDNSLVPKVMLPFQLACTVGGYIVGCAVPKALQNLLHPVVVTAVLANAGAAAIGSLQGYDYVYSLKAYYAKGALPMGAGDLLMAFLGIVIISFGFRIYAQRETMRRHAPEILGATVLSALFSMYSTAFAARFLGLAPDLARAVIPRSVTVALALPIAGQLAAPLSITAAAVLLQGLLGANFGPNLMTKVGIKDTIARGLAAAATAGGLGTASLTAREPEALPFCALSYSMIGIISTFLAAIPLVRASLIAITG